MIHKVDNAMSSDDVTGVVLIIPSQSETVPRNPHKQILLIVIGGGHAVQILMIEKGLHDSTAATHDNGLDAAVNPTWLMQWSMQWFEDSRFAISHYDSIKAR